MRGTRCSRAGDRCGGFPCSEPAALRMERVLSACRLAAVAMLGISTCRSVRGKSGRIVRVFSFLRAISRCSRLLFGIAAGKPQMAKFPSFFSFPKTKKRASQDGFGVTARTARGLALKPRARERSVLMGYASWVVRSYRACLIECDPCARSLGSHSRVARGDAFARSRRTLA